MAYTSMKKLIANANAKLESGGMTQEEYDLFKNNSMNKLDVFLACNRLSGEQYTELSGMLLEAGSEGAEV